MVINTGVSCIMYMSNSDTSLGAWVQIHSWNHEFGAWNDTSFKCTKKLTTTPANQFSLFRSNVLICHIFEPWFKWLLGEELVRRNQIWTIYISIGSVWGWTWEVSVSFSEYYCIRTLPRGGTYWVVHPRRPRDFPRPQRCPEGKARGTSRGLREISRSEEMCNPIFPDSRRCTAILSS